MKSHVEILRIIENSPKISSSAELSSILEDEELDKILQNLTYFFKILLPYPFSPQFFSSDSQRIYNNNDDGEETSSVTGCSICEKYKLYYE